jgi:hypothetical protein
VIDDVKDCSPAEVQAQIAYLDGTPVRGIAHLLRKGRCRLRKGVVRSLAFLKSLKTEFGKLGPHEPAVEQGEPKFRVAEVLPLLRGDPDSGGELLTAVEAILAKDERDIEYNVTVMRIGADLIVKDGNKRTIAFCERSKDAGDQIEYPVFLVELTDVLERVTSY